MKSILSVMILILLLTAGCTRQQGASDPVMIDEPDIPKSAGLALDELPEFTLEDLALYNGQDGMPAYVAVEDSVYDVTDHPEWTSGEHGGNMAGTDITLMLQAAPHGMSKLSELQKVGLLKVVVDPVLMDEPEAVK